MNYQIETQEKFEKLLQTKFTQLKPINKWRQTMWHLNGKVIVSLVHLTKKSKFCFFNNPEIELDRLQRWGSTVYSKNLEFINNQVEWDAISNLIENTIKNQIS